MLTKMKSDLIFTDFESSSDDLDLRVLNPMVDCVTTESKDPSVVFRERILIMDHDELMQEFLSMMERFDGEDMTLSQLENAKFVMEQLFVVATHEPFRIQLLDSIQICIFEIAKLRN